MVKPDDMDGNAPGRIVPVTGMLGTECAFVPAPLPPSCTWPDRLWPLLTTAREDLARLDGTGKSVVNPDLVLRPLQNREAQKSSSLEGTYTDPEQQMLFALEPTEPSSSADPVNAQREVFNYAQALQLRRSRDELPLSLRLIRELHRVLMTGVRSSDRQPGEFRRLQNQIGRPPRYVPPPANLLPELLDNFEKYLHTQSGLDPLVRAFVAHYQFEAIHPFMDGNGRVGRLLLALCIADWCGLSNQWLYMSAYFDRNKDEYIDRLFEVSTSGAWEAWIEFCLRGVAEQARDTTRRYEQLIELHRQFHAKVNESGGSVRLSHLVDQLFLSPVIQVTTARDLLDVTYPTARTDLRKLADLEIIHELKGARQIAYGCRPIFNVIYQD